MILTAIALVVAGAPSFDCSKASTKVEKMICADEELAAVDRGMARLYASMRRSERYKGQAEWLAKRNRCHDRDCLLDAYDDRIFDIGFAATAPRYYSSSDNNGTLAILDVGGGWYCL